MNIYQVLNQITLYIENHLNEKIDYQTLSKMMGVNVYIMQRIFSTITGIPLAEYIRKRRLSVAVNDLLKGEKVMDVAIKYGYQNATSFSRSFYLFHGVKPSKLTSNSKILNYPRLIFDENIKQQREISYEIIEQDELKLYGLGIDVTNENIKSNAPKHIEKIRKEYLEELGEVAYGLTIYDDSYHTNVKKYYALYEKDYEGFESLIIPKNKWLKFTVKSQETKVIQNMINDFYREFLPSSHYSIGDIIELEHYTLDTTEFLIAISD